jgi:phosphoglycolate phosphatase
LRSLVQRNGLQYPIFVGDGEGDRLAAKDCGIPFVFAAYGFGSCSEWTFKVETFSDLERSLSNQDGVSSDG